MKKRIITLFLVIVIAFTLLTPTFAEKIKIIEDNAKVINFESLTDLIMTNFEITDSYTEQLITIVTFQSWDGDLSGEDVTDALKELGIRNPKNSVGMTIIFDIEQGNYGIKIGGRVKDLFDDNDAAKYLENHFRPHYEKGHYTAAVFSLSNALYRWYEQNYTTIYQRLHPWYTSPVFIILAAIIFAVFIHVLYGNFARLAHLKHCFDAYYIEQDLPIPFFGLRQIWSAPFYCSHDRSIWSFAGEIWKEEHPFLSCFEPLEVKRNAFDIIAIVLKIIILIFMCFLLLLSGGFSNSSGSSGSSGNSRNDYSSSSRGGGGGGRSGGGGGGRR